MARSAIGISRHKVMVVALRWETACDEVFRRGRRRCYWLADQPGNRDDAELGFSEVQTMLPGMRLSPSGLRQASLLVPVCRPANRRFCHRRHGAAGDLTELYRTNVLFQSSPFPLNQVWNVDPCPHSDGLSGMAATGRQRPPVRRIEAGRIAWGRPRPGAAPWHVPGGSVYPRRQLSAGDARRCASATSVWARAR